MIEMGKNQIQFQIHMLIIGGQGHQFEKNHRHPLASHQQDALHNDIRGVFSSLSSRLFIIFSVTNSRHVQI